MVEPQTLPHTCCGMSAEKGFTTFLEDLYYSVLGKQLQEKKNNLGSCVPLIPIHRFVSGTAEEERRSKLVQQASKKDCEYTEAAMKRDRAEKADALSETQNQFFLQMPIEKNKFAVGPTVAE